MINWDESNGKSSEKENGKAQTIECSREWKMINPWNDENIIEDQKLKAAWGKLFFIINFFSKREDFAKISFVSRH